MEAVQRFLSRLKRSSKRTHHRAEGPVVINPDVAERIIVKGRVAFA